MNNKGFTLVELLMIIALLAIVILIAGPYIAEALDNSKKKSYDILLSNIKTSSITYFQECKYNGSVIGCQVIDNKLEVSLQELMDNGYLEGSTECNDTDCENVVKNPIDKVNIGSCIIQIKQVTKSEGRVEYNITGLTTSNSSCPQGDLGSVS